jgi:proteasome-associated ATPase
MIEALRAEDSADQSLLEQLIAVGEGAPPLDHRMRLLQMLRGRSRERGRQVDEFLIGTIIQRGDGLLGAEQHMVKMRAKLGELLAPPWHPALFVRLLPDFENRRRALVVHSGARRVVDIAGDLDPAALGAGDEVFLSRELNTIVGCSPQRVPACGETAIFERYTSDGRAVLKWRDEVVVAQIAAAMDGVELRAGDLVRWDRTMLFAFERVERADGEHLFLEETPRETFADIGGLRPQIELLKRSIGLQLFHADLARKYRQRRRGSALFVGPPGTGKTMVARAFCNWLANQSPSGRARFMNIKPAGLHSSWYAQSEANYREAFRVAREAGAADPLTPVVIFFDEVDAVGATRGQHGARIDDRVQTAFMAELDGLEGRGNVLVLAATNRRAAIDPALLRPGRLGDLIIEIPRPGMAAARDIFARYMPADIPYDDAGVPPAARARVLDGLVAALYAPNGQSTVATLRFRDGSQRPVRAADLLSGAEISQIAAAAIERACVREIETGEAGVRLEDALDAAAEQLESAAKALRPVNCRSYLADLPDDVDVVAVEPAASKVRRPHRYRNAA